MQDASARGRDWQLWWRWTFAVAAGELIGFAVPALAGAGLAALGLVDTLAGRAALVMAGIGEGSVLGIAQWLALRRRLPALAGRSWVLVTAIAAGVAWVIGLVPSSLGSAPAVTPAFMVVAGLLGVVFLVLMGGAQWLVLRSHVPRAWWWIPANAVAWAVGVTVPVIALGLVPDESPMFVFAAAGIGGGALMGVVVGGITGLALVRLLRSLPAEKSRGRSVPASDFYNPLLALVLRSPLHGLMSGDTMLITVSGRSTGRRYTTPVNYVRQGDTLWTVSRLERRWWRNLRGGAPVTVQLQGQALNGNGDVIEGEQAVANSLARCLEQTPAYARYLGVRLCSDGRPDGGDIARAARGRVIVQVRLA